MTKRKNVEKATWKGNEIQKVPYSFVFFIYSMCCATKIRNNGILSGLFI